MFERAGFKTMAYRSRPRPLMQLGEQDRARRERVAPADPGGRHEAQLDETLGSGAEVHVRRAAAFGDEPVRDAEPCQSLGHPILEADGLRMDRRPRTLLNQAHPNMHACLNGRLTRGRGGREPLMVLHPVQPIG